MAFFSLLAYMAKKVAQPAKDGALDLINLSVVFVSLLVPR
jgi:hypothetical protein